MTPDPPPRPWRRTARLLLVHDERLLMLRAYDPEEPALGEWWEVPGGGVEPGESTAAAAVRETAEETGYVVAPADVGPVCYRGSATYRWLGRRHWTDVVVHVARPAALPPRREQAWQPEEALSFLETAWLPVADVAAGRDTYFPGTLPADLPRLLAGEVLDGGFSVWS